MANPMQAGPLFSGASSLIGALTGGAGVQEAARQKEQMRLLAGQTAEATLDQKITQAFLSRDKRQAQQDYEKNLTPVMGADAARVAAGFAVGGNANLEQVQRYGMRDRAEDAFSADPNFTPGNAIMAVLGGKPVPGVANVDGQNVTGIYGNAPVIDNSDKTASVIGANVALAGQRDASGRASDARAYRTLNPVWNPNTGGGTGGKPEKPGAYTAPSQATLGATLGWEMLNDKPVPNRANTIKYKKWQARQSEVDPRYRNGEFALAQYMSGKPAIRGEYDFGAGPVKLTADQDPEAIGALKSMIIDRRAQGLPEMTNAQRVAAILEFDRTGGMRDLNGNAPGVIEPKPVTGERRIVNPKTGEVRVLRNNQWVAP